MSAAQSLVVASVVLDASALLALLNDEPGAETVAGAMHGALISAVNLSEVVSRLAESGLPEEAIRATLRGLALEAVPFDAEQGYRAGMLRVSTRAAGLSLGDRACLSLATTLGLTAMTADRAWQDLPVDAEVVMVR